MSVGEIVDAVDVGQSTVSHHLKLLADTGFVLVERRERPRAWPSSRAARRLRRYPWDRLFRARRSGDQTVTEVVMGRALLG